MYNPEDDNKPRTKEDQVYEHLKDLLLNGEIPTDRFLSQRTLAAKAGAAVITVRGALRQLESDGLIEYIPQWGVRVPSETPETLKDRYYMRRLFEVEAVHRIIEKRESLDPSHLIELGRKCDQITLNPEGDSKEYGKYHYQLHSGIVALAGSRLMSQMFERINLRHLFFWNAYRVWQLQKLSFLADHEKLVKDIFSLEGTVVIEEMERHVMGGLENELLIIAQQKQ